MIRVTHMLSLQNPGSQFNKIGNVRTKLHCAMRSRNPIAMGTKQHSGIAVADNNINATMAPSALLFSCIVLITAVNNNHSGFIS